MTQMPIIIFASDNGWRISHGNSVHDIASSIGQTPAQVAAEIAAIIGSPADDVTLALPASWCLSATVSLTGVPVRNRRTALLYRLELLLPFTAEQVAADYILNEPESALAVCVPVATVKPFIDAIEAEGVLIHSVVPASVFAATSILALHNAIDVVLWQSSESMELFTANDGKVTGWFVFPANANDLRWHLDYLTQKGRVRNVMASNVESALVDQLKANKSLQLAAVDSRSIEQVVRSAIAAGEAAPVNLRQDRLLPRSPFRAIRRPLNEAILASVLLVVCICGAASWRAARLRQLASTNRDQETKLFLQLFPGHSVPVNIVSRLKSEDRALKADNSSDAKPPRHSTLVLLQNLLGGIASLPTQSRLEVDDLKIEGGKFSLDGFVKGRSDLTNVVDAMQQTSSIKLDPPQTEQAAGKGLHIILTGLTEDNRQAK